MLARSAQICVLVRSLAMRSLDTKLSVVPGVKCEGNVIEDWVAILEMACAKEVGGMDTVVVLSMLLSFSSSDVYICRLRTLIRYTCIRREPSTVLLKPRSGPGRAGTSS
jgi:hypothetical protein